MRRSTALTAAAAALLLVAAAYMSLPAYVERSEEVETRRMFRDWMAKFAKTYGSIGEEEHRYAVFKENLRRLDKHKHGTSVDAAWLPNIFGDLTEEELRRMAGGSVITTKDKEEFRSLNLGWIDKVKRFNFQLGPHN